jgi:hypothetical protein
MEGSHMGQVRHGSATTTHAVRAAIQRSQASLSTLTRFRRLVKDYEQYAETLAGLHVVAFACLMMKQAVALAAGS